MKNILALFLLIFSSTLHAHFTHFEPRIIHLYQEQKDTIILMRMPLPLILLNEQWEGIDKEQNIPYTNKIKDANGVNYIVDHQFIRNNLDTFKTLIHKGYKIEKNSQPQNYLVDSIHIFNTDKRKPFSSLETALDNFSGNITIKPDALDLFDSGIDIALRLPNTSIIKNDISIHSILGDKFNAINRLANIVNLHSAHLNTSETTVGILNYSSIRQASTIKKLLNSFYDGVKHILIGLDHVLFVLLLFYSAPTFLRLLSLATAFTIGHSFSLVFGNNILISSPLFTPSIELLIAFSIMLSAVALLTNKTKLIGTTPLLIIGIIHGFGFSFVYKELQNVGAETSLGELFSFTAGIEAGQIIIYCIAFIITQIIQSKFPLIKPLKYQVSLLAIIISIYWILTRATPIVQHFA